MMQMNQQETVLFEQAMSEFTAQYDPAVGLLRGEGEEAGHGVRPSIYYALSLLMQGGQDALAARVMRAVLDVQYPENGTVYDGTFKRTLEEADPPANPTVWDDYDPNWREFIGSVLCVILNEFSDRLSPADQELARRGIARAVRGSIRRRLDDDTPMNSNVQLMHLFITSWSGEHLGEAEHMAKAEDFARELLDDFKRTDTLAEFNSTTYYGVDLIALSLLRKFIRSETVRETANYIHEKLWESIASLYSPSLENLCGPYSRFYEMEMTEHSTLGHVLYHSLGERLRHLAHPNCETFDNPLAIMAGVEIPEHLHDRFLTEGAPRTVTHQFYELCERHPKGGRRFLCTATSCLQENFMLGALDGSRNTSGQLCPGTIFWKHEGKLHWMRISRRRPGGRWGEHFTGIYFHGKATPDCFDMGVELSGDKPIEVFAEFFGPGMGDAKFEADRFTLPGLTCKVSYQAEGVEVRRIADNRVELCALYDGSKNHDIHLTLSDFVRD